MAITLVLVSFCVAITLATPECQVLQISTMKVSLTTRENATGNWNTQVVFNQGAVGGGNGGLVWVGGVEQKIVRCDKNEPEIETSLLLQASPSTVAPTPERKQPPKDYELFTGVGYYKFHPEQILWPEARTACDTEGGHLIIINSEEENGVAKQILASHPRAGTWFHAGFLEMGTNGQYYTIFGQRLESTGFSTFLRGENNDPGANDQGVINRNGGIADIPPGNRLSFICEFDLQ